MSESTLTAEQLRLECLKIANSPTDTTHNIMSKAHLFWAFVNNEKSVVPASKPVEIESAEDTKVTKKNHKENATEKVELEAPKVTYDDVKTIVLKIAKEKGRDASLDLLAPFGVVTGEGAKRSGSIGELKENQWADVIEAAKKFVA